MEPANESAEGISFSIAPFAKKGGVAGVQLGLVKKGVKEQGNMRMLSKQGFDQKIVVVGDCKGVYVQVHGIGGQGF